MISKDKIIEYTLINEKARYEAFKAITACVKHIVITLLLCITLIACAYMYFVVPVEEEYAVADNNSQVVASSIISGDNINGR
jgi:hypothetical protein